MNIHELRKELGVEIIDFNLLKYALREYAHPRGKINQWLQTGDLIRVKKGLYVFGKTAQREPFSLELLANLIYGPSAISLQYALAYYGLIPEVVHTVTSITSKRHKNFKTPVADFTYTYLQPAKFATGIQLLSLSDHLSIFIATPEKALCDIVSLQSKHAEFKSAEDVDVFLFSDLRIDRDAFAQLSFDDMQVIAACYRNSRLNKFIKYLNQWKTMHE